MALVWTATDTDVRNWAYDNPITWTDAAIGTAAADRIVVLTIMSVLRVVTDVTIGGVTATAVEQVGSGCDLSMWRAAVPTGTTAEVVVTFAVGGPQDLCMSIGSLTGATAAPTATPVDEWGTTGAGGTVSVTGTIPTGGIMLFAAGAITRTFAWTFDKGTADSAVIAGATSGALRAGSFGTAGSQTVTATGTAWDEAGMVGGVWEAAATTPELEAETIVTVVAESVGWAAYQNARPDADVADGGWLNEAASNTNLHLSVGEGIPNLATYIRSSTDPVNDTCTLGLTDIANPADGEILIRVIARWVE